VLKTMAPQVRDRIHVITGLDAELAQLAPAAPDR
jgi:hypothetical protein